jgi:hypothetical protein
MASWIVHLRIAEKLLAAIPGLDAALFAIGNIAPDSGIPDEKWENFTPPPEVTHFVSDWRLAYAHEDLRFFCDYLQPLPKKERETYAFRLGYFFHLLTDNLWRAQVHLPTKRRYAAEFAADKDFIWEVKKDWYGLDFLYLRDHPESEIWKLFTTCEYHRQDLVFLPVEAVQQRLEYIKTYYGTITDRVLAAYQRPYIYLSQSDMDQFVATTAHKLFNIYQRLDEQAPIPTEVRSALEL